MSGYGGGIDMVELLKAMRDKARQDTVDLQYLSAVSITSSTRGTVISKPMLFLVPLGSPEEDLGEGVQTTIRRATHMVEVVPAIFTVTPYDEDPIIGAGKSIGIVEHTQNVLKFFGGNILSLTGIDTEMRPKIEAPANAYSTFHLQDDDVEGFLLTASLNYEARTMPFDSTNR